MKVPIRRLDAKLCQMSPLTLTGVGMLYVLLVAVLDRLCPSAMSFSLFYLLGVALVGWCSGSRRAVVAVSLASAVALALQEFLRTDSRPPTWVGAWNVAARLALFLGTGWLVVEISRLTRNLERMVEERTAQWKAEGQQHQATSTRLGEALDRFEQVINNIAEVFWLTNVHKNQMVYVSPGYERVWGRRCEELYREPESWVAAVHPADRDEVLRRAQTDQAAGSYDVEYRILRPDGAMRWIRDRAFPVRNEQGEVYRIAGLAEDITERKRTWEVLQTQAAILENMAEGVVVTDEQGVIVQMNPASERIWGYERDEMLGQPVSMFSTLPEPEAKASMRKVLEALAATGSWRGTFKNRRKDGATIFCEAVISRLEVQGRRLMVAVEQDVTERKEAESTLARQEALYRALFELSPNGILLEDASRTILDVNQAFCASSGYTRQELLRSNVRRFVPAEDQSTVEAHLAILRAGSPQEHEVWNLRKSGERRLIRLNEKRITLPDGSQRIMVVTSDVTERRRSELMKEAFLSLGTKLSEVQSPLAAGRAVFATADQFWQWDAAVLQLYSPERDCLNSVLLIDVVDGERREVPPPYPDTAPPPILRQIMQNGAELILRTPADAQLREFIAFGNAERLSASLIYVPLRREGIAVGVLSIQSYTPNAYTQEDLRTLQALADHCAGALERIKAEQALQASEERYRALAESSPDAIFILDRDIKVQYVNSRAAALWRRAPKELIGLTQSELFPPEEAKLHCWVVAEVFETGQAVRRDALVTFPVGEQWIEIGLVPLFGEPGTVTSVMGVCRDITDRKRAERQLTEALDLNQKMIAASTLGIAAYRASGECVFANDAMARITGGSISEVLQQNFRVLESWQESGLLQLAEEALSQGQARLGEVYSTSSFGRTVWLDCHMAPFVSSGQPHLLLMVLDITKRKRAEAAFKQAERLQRAILDTIPDPAWLKDAKGQFLACNQAFARYCGRPVEAILGMTDFDCLLAEADRTTREDKEVMTTRRSIVVEVPAADAQGGVRWLESIKAPLFNEREQVVGTVGIARDVTQRRSLERQILEISDREQARIGQDIHDGLCQQLVSLAFDANSLQSALAGQRRPEVKTARRIADCLDQAITETRQLSRGLFPVRLETDGLPPALEELAKATGAHFKIQCRFHSEGPVAVENATIATHLYRIAQEALTNAVKHSQARKVSIRLKAGAKQIELRVEDDGAGFPPAKRANATGMGLHIMDYRARAIGGTLHFGPGRRGGTVVSCCIPRGSS